MSRRGRSLSSRDLKRHGPTGDRVLITGEPSGKEAVAHELCAFRSEKRRNKPFEVVKCGSLDPTTADNELFGSVPGAFTGAVDRGGLFERSNGGVLFLDESGDLPLPTQVKLLRAVQDGLVRRVGGSERKLDVRLIAATDQDLHAKAQRGEFRVPLLIPASGSP